MATSPRYKGRACKFNYKIAIGAISQLATALTRWRGGEEFLGPLVASPNANASIYALYLMDYALYLMEVRPALSRARVNNNVRPLATRLLLRQCVGESQRDQGFSSHRT